MDCRMFHRKLEDYLEDSLDFPSRFGMERHAKQCLACEGVVNAAIKLRQRVQGLPRMTAPADFETAILTRIRNESAKRRHSWLRDRWVFGLEGFSWRVAAVTAAATVVIVLAATHVYFESRIKEPLTQLEAVGNAANPPAEEAAAGNASVFGSAGAEAALTRISDSSPAGISRFGKDDWAIPYADPGDSEYFEFLVPFAGDEKLILQVPRTIRMRYQQPSREYFIRHVSH